MSDCLRVFFIPHGRLQACFGSKDYSFLSNLMEHQAKEIAGDDEAFDYKLQKGAPSMKQALTEIVEGKPTYFEDGYVYGYALEHICRELAKNESHPLFEGVHYLHAWTKDAVIFPEFFSGEDYPISIPMPGDYPYLGFVSPNFARSVLDKYRDTDLSKTTVVEPGKGLLGWFRSPLTRTVDAPDRVVAARNQVLSWLKKASEQNLDVFTFY